MTDESNKPKGGPEGEPKGEPKGEPEGESVEKFETFTQADLDKKMARSKRETKAAEKVATELQEALDKIAEEKMSDEEKVRAETEKARSELEALKAERDTDRLWISKRQAAIKAGMTGDIVDAAMDVASAVDEEDILASLETLAKLTTPATPKSATPGGQGGGEGASSREDQLREAHRTGDLAKVLKLQNEIYRGE